MEPLTHAAVVEEVQRAEEALKGLGARHARLWERARIEPALWSQQQYPDEAPVWVVAVIGRRCLYFNAVEAGWGWGRFDTWGAVSGYHWQQDEIQHSVHQLLFAIDHGGQG